MNKELSDYFGSGQAAQGDWFPWFESRVDTATGEIAYDAPAEGAMEFCIRSMTGYFEEINKGRKKESKMVLNPFTRAMERVSYYPDLAPEEEEKRTQDAWDYAIIGVRKGGETVECTKEDKLELIKRPKFLRFAQRAFQILSGEASGAKETAEKK